MNKNMRTKNLLIYTLIAPTMVLISIFGFAFRTERKKIFYVPIGTIGIYLILSKDFSRRLIRKKILNKIKFFKNNK
tara:strand:- start:1436 stop:1663 length:228 start_codon:yes stop_codon:yes gene_type:complete